MALVASCCALLVVLTTVIHYEVLRGLSAALAGLQGASRAKLLAVIFATFAAHALEILLYAAGVYLLSRYAHLGSLGHAGSSLSASVYFSAETYTSLGYGDIVPTGDLRLLAGIEALNGLLLIGWSASYTYLAMERFWKAG
jgi:voltage-gated potassium channel Kch